MIEVVPLHQDQTLNIGIVQLFPLEEITYTGSKESELTDHGIQSHKASDKVVKVHVAVFVAVAADDQLVQLVVQRETCKTHMGSFKISPPFFLSQPLQRQKFTCGLEGSWHLLGADHSRTIGVVVDVDFLLGGGGKNKVSVATKWIIRS